jgi:hypothetical protein
MNNSCRFQCGLPRQSRLFYIWTRCEAPNAMTKDNKQEAFQLLQLSELLGKLPPREERKKVRDFILSCGFSEKWIDDECFGREYALFRDAMLQREWKAQ